MARRCRRVSFARCTSAERALRTSLFPHPLSRVCLIEQLHKNRKKRGHVSAGHGRIGKHRKHPAGRGNAGGQHHNRINMDKYHPGYFGKVRVFGQGVYTMGVVASSEPGKGVGAGEGGVKRESSAGVESTTSRGCATSLRLRHGEGGRRRLFHGFILLGFRYVRNGLLLLSLCTRARGEGGRRQKKSSWTRKGAPGRAGGFDTPTLILSRRRRVHGMSSRIRRDATR